MLGFLVAVAVWAFRPWTSAVTLDDKGRQALYTCGPPFGSASVEPANGDARSPTALVRRPCSTRGERRTLAVADLAVGTAGLVLLLMLKRPQPAVEVGCDHEKH